jgi:hypothetical protein
MAGPVATVASPRTAVVANRQAREPEREWDGGWVREPERTAERLREPDRDTVADWEPRDWQRLPEEDTTSDSGFRGALPEAAPEASADIAPRDEAADGEPPPTIGPEPESRPARRPTRRRTRRPPD